MTFYSEVLFEEVLGEDGNLGVITLNRPNVLNSLNHNMVIAMYHQLQTWSYSSEIKAVVICGALEKAFCAGGDLRLTYERYMTHDPALLTFFYDEYQLNRLIFHYPKPYIALLSGITMGGGVGISIHGSHRIAAENLLFAMPETGIGFFPDVGGSYFLPRLAGKMGFYLGLTGAKIKVEDCLALGLIQHCVNYEKFPVLIQALANQSFHQDADQRVTEIINQFKVSVSVSSLIEKQVEIDKVFSENNMEKIMQGVATFSPLLKTETEQALSKKSPTSLKVTLKALQKGKDLNFDECMRQEYRLTSHFLQSHDFLEGIRALIIDKDQNPNWLPSSLVEVPDKMIDSYFAPLEKELA